MRMKTQLSKTYEMQQIRLIAVNAYIKIEKRSQISKLTSYLKKEEK